MLQFFGQFLLGDEPHWTKFLQHKTWSGFHYFATQQVAVASDIVLCRGISLLLYSTN